MRIADVTLVAVHCSGCGRRLTETLCKAAVFCPHCGKWSRAERPPEPRQQSLWSEANKARKGARA